MLSEKEHVQWFLTILTLVPVAYALGRWGVVGVIIVATIVIIPASISDLLRARELSRLYGKRL